MSECPNSRLGHNPALHGRGCAGCDAEHARMVDKHLGPSPVFRSQSFESKTYLTITNEGRIVLGPDITWDEAAEFFLDALERQIGRRITGVERNSTSDQPKKGDAP